MVMTRAPPRCRHSESGPRACVLSAALACPHVQEEQPRASAVGRYGRAGRSASSPWALRSPPRPAWPGRRLAFGFPGRGFVRARRVSGWCGTGRHERDEVRRRRLLIRRNNTLRHRRAPPGKDSIPLLKRMSQVRILPGAHRPGASQRSGALGVSGEGDGPLSLVAVGGDEEPALRAGDGVAEGGDRAGLQAEGAETALGGDERLALGAVHHVEGALGGGREGGVVDLLGSAAERGRAASASPSS